MRTHFKQPVSVTILALFHVQLLAGRDFLLLRPTVQQIRDVGSYSDREVAILVKDLKFQYLVMVGYIPKFACENTHLHLETFPWMLLSFCIRLVKLSILQFYTRFMTSRIHRVMIHGISLLGLSLSIALLFVSSISSYITLYTSMLSSYDRPVSSGAHRSACCGASALTGLDIALT